MTWTRQFWNKWRGQNKAPPQSEEFGESMECDPSPIEGGGILSISTPISPAQWTMSDASTVEMRQAGSSESTMDLAAEYTGEESEGGNGYRGEEGTPSPAPRVTREQVEYIFGISDNLWLPPH